VSYLVIVVEKDVGAQKNVPTFTFSLMGEKTLLFLLWEKKTSLSSDATSNTSITKKPSKIFENSVYRCIVDFSIVCKEKFCMPQGHEHFFS